MLPIHLRNAMVLLMLAVVAMPSEGKPQPDDPKTVPPVVQGMEGWWNDLASTEDEGRANRALLAFAAKPKESATFFKELLKPVKVDADQVKKLVAQLDDARFAKREAAVKQLEYLGKFARPALEQCLKENQTLEVKKRIEKMIELFPTDPAEAKPMAEPMPKPMGLVRGISISTAGGVTKITVDGQTYDLSKLTNAPPVIIAPRMNGQWLRAVRAVVILENIGTPEAKALLESMASGEKEAPPTVEAKAALDRLGKSK